MPYHLTNAEILARQAEREQARTAAQANPYLQRTNDRLAELRAKAFEQAYGQQTASLTHQQR